MYICKTYSGEMRRFCKSIDTQTLINKIFEYAGDEYLQKLAIDYFSTSYEFTIADLEEIFCDKPTTMLDILTMDIDE